MNVSLAWLKEFVATSTKGNELGEKFRMTSSECEGIEDWSEKLKGLVVGQVLKVKPHPNADRLRIATVEADIKRTIVCGAPNLAEGQTVIVATPGTLLTPTSGESFTIQESTIRGEKSEGMLCALEEIGIALPSDGIFVIDGDHKPGTEVAKALFENDTVIDLEITPNRPDLLSHVGLAREVSAFEQRTLKAPSITAQEVSKNYSTKLALDLTNHKDASRFSVLALQATVKPSPWWLQSRLLRSGIRPINTIVDVTNYVMLEIGQPLHAYDKASIPTRDGAHVLGVGKATGGETIALLDETVRTLENGDLVITDAHGTALGLAGLMGGATSGVTDTTTEIILESANFNAAQIRRTSRRLGLRSEASLRFEKGIDPELTVFALKRAATLLIEIADGKITSKLVDSHAHAPVRPRIRLSFDEIHSLLGVRISASDCKEILTKLGFTLHSFTKSGFETIPPTWRRDVLLPEDVIEELIRIWGYHHLPLTLPMGAVKPPSENASVTKKRLIRHALAATGAHETLHLTFSSEQDYLRLNLNPKEALPLANPLSAETAVLNSTHLLGMLADCGGVNREEAELTLFEIGKVFTKPTTEEERLTLLVRTAREPLHAIRSIKSHITRVCQILRLPEPLYTETKGLPYAESGHTHAIRIDGTPVGTLALIAQEVVSNHKIRRGREIVAAEINLEALLALNPVDTFYAPVPTYPVSERDLTIQVNQAVKLEALMQIAEKHIDSKLVRTWHIADIYRGKPLSDTEQAITLKLTYNSPDRTLTDEEIKKHHDALEKALLDGTAQ